MMNCPTSPPPAPPAEGGEGETNPDAGGDDDKPEIKRQSMKNGWKIMEACKEKGLCKSLGVSNFSVQAMLNLFPFVNVKPTVNQVESHPYLIQKNLYAVCKKMKVTLIAYCPLLRKGKDQKQVLGDKIDFLGDPVLK